MTRRLSVPRCDASRALLGVVAIAWVLGCEGSTPITEVEDPEVPDPEVVSDSAPIVSDPVAGSTAARLAFASFTPQSGDAGAPIVYVSLRPGAVPNGGRATIQRRGSTSTVTAVMEDGGLNPVPIAAADGDTVDVDVLLTGGGSVRFAVRVPVTRRPKVVRTYPPPKKRDVALNAGIVVVFTEPVAATTLTSSSVRLLKGGSPVPGAVRLLEGTTNAVVFEPSAPLDPGVEYILVVTEAVRDLAGDALEEGDPVTFTTGSALEGPVERVDLAPDSAAVLVGSQLQLTAIVRDSSGNVIAGRPVRWTSSDVAVATISATGLVTALTEGATFITAEVDGQIGGVGVTVSATLPPVASVTLVPKAGRVAVGDTLILTADTRDSAGHIVHTPRVLSWSSTNTAVATVAVNSSRTAVVRGLTDGVARITVAVDGAEDTSIVTVGPPGPPAGLVLSPARVSVVLRATVRLTSRSTDTAGGLNPVDSTDVAWTSSDPSIASVDTTGLVTGLRAGSVTIEGTWSGHRGTATVTVVSLSFSQIRAGGSHTCGLAPSGAAYCWGYGWDGQIGSGTRDFVLMPMAVEGELTFASVDVYWNTSCGLTTTGAAYCWGLNQTGQERCPNGACSPTPVAVAGGLRFIALSVGGWHTCGLTSDGAAHCWEGLDWSMSPTTLPGGLAFASITSGGSHSCALTSDGVAYCWGSNYAGQLGGFTPNECDGFPCSRSPIAVAGGLRFSRLTAGETHTCGLTVNGATYCWGVPSAYGRGGSATPAPVMSGVTFVALSGKAGYTCGLVANGTIHCWDDWGSSATRAPWTVPGAFAFTSLSSGEGYSCAVTAARVGYCWGRNDMGQLGTGTTSDFVGQPVKVGGQP